MGCEPGSQVLVQCLDGCTLSLNQTERRYKTRTKITAMGGVETDWKKQTALEEMNINQFPS